MRFSDFQLPFFCQTCYKYLVALKRIRVAYVVFIARKYFEYLCVLLHRNVHRRRRQILGDNGSFIRPTRYTIYNIR